jgi:hypothetical protein
MDATIVTEWNSEQFAVLHLFVINESDLMVKSIFTEELQKNVQIMFSEI